MKSENLKLALSRIVSVLPHLKADGAAIPTAHRPTIEEIRREAAKTAQSTRDPQLEAAERWALAEIEKALAADAPAPEAIQPDAPQSTGTEPGVSTYATVEQGGVALHEKALGDLSDAELESLTAPKEGK